MKIQISIKHILWLLGFAIGYYLYSNIKIIDIPVKRKLIEKYVTSDRYGQANYNYRWQLQDGTTQTDTEPFEASNNYELGKTYIFYEQSIELK